MAITIINLSDQVSALVTKTNEISGDLGDAADLLNGDSTVVDAVNNIGTLASLNRTAADLVSAVNLVDSALTAQALLINNNADSDFGLFQTHYTELLAADDSLNTSLLANIDSVNASLIAKTDSNNTDYIALEARVDSESSALRTAETRLDGHDSDIGVGTELNRMRSTIGIDTLAAAITNTYELVTQVDSDLVDLDGALTTTARQAVSATNTGSGYGTLSYNTELGQFTFNRVTPAEIRAQVSVTDAGGDGSLSYDNGSGVLTYTGPSASEARAHFAAVDAGGDGSFAYDSATGKFTYTGPSASEVRAHFTAGDGIDIAAGVISGENASTSNKGIALFSSANFAVSGGTVTIKDGGIVEAELANDAVSADKLKDVQTLIIYNSGGSAIKTIYGAGS